MQCACVLLYPGVRQAVQYFWTFSHKLHDFLVGRGVGGWGEVGEHEMFVLIFCATFI